MADISKVTLLDSVTYNIKDETARADKLDKSGGTMTGDLILSGPPTADLHAATKKYVDDAVGDITGMEFRVVQQLPATGETHIIYLVPKTGSTNDIYDEYIYVDNHFDKIGTTEIDLSEYVHINGSTMTGALILHGDPTANLEAATKKYVDDSIPVQATETTSGIVKLNPSESVTLNSDGQLIVGGRLGQYPDGGGVYYPTSIEPTNVGGSSFLMTDGAKGISVSQRTFAIMGGANITCKSAAAGSTQYRVSNTHANRFACCAVKGGRAALNQADAIANGTVLITSIKYANGNDVTVHFGPNESDNDIIITLERTINPNSTTSLIRCYGSNSQTDNILVGQGVGAIGGKVISLGQSTFAGGNQTVAIGNSVHVTANNSVGLGHTMLVNKQYSFGVGQGHDFTNGTNGSTAIGTWSIISSNSRFVVGNGTNNSRSNIFEVTDDSGQTGVILKSPNGTRYKVRVDDSGNLSTTSV